MWLAALFVTLLLLPVALVIFAVIALVLTFLSDAKY